MKEVMLAFMKKLDETVRREVTYISLFVLLLSVLMQAIFLLLNCWDLSVLFGNLLGGAAAAGNFFLMAITIQIAVEKEKKDAQNLMKLSQLLRMLLLLILLVTGVLLDCFNTWSTLIPLLFPQIAILLRPLFSKKNGGEK